MRDADDQMGARTGGKPRTTADGMAAGKLLSFAVEAGDFDAASEVVRGAWFHLMAGNGTDTAVTLGQIPSVRLREYPLLTMLLGICYNAVQYRRVKAIRLFVRSVRAAHSSRRDLDPVDRILILVSESVAYRLLGHPRLGVKPAHRAIAMLDNLEDSARDRIHQLPYVYSQAGVTLYYGGKVFESLDTFAKGLAESPETGKSVGFANIAMLAGIHALRGEFHEADTYLEIARGESWTTEELSRYSGTLYRIAEARSALERFDTEHARGHLEAMDHDPRTIEHWHAIVTTTALTELVGGRPGSALAGLDAYMTARNREARAAGPRGMLASTRALLQLALGHPDAAEAILERDGTHDAQGCVDKARVQLVLGRQGAALMELRSVAGNEESPRTVAEAAVVEAATLLRFSKSTRTRTVIEHLGALLEKTGQRLPLALLPPADFAAVQSALCAAGYGSLFTTAPIRALLPATDNSDPLTERERVVLGVLMRTGSTKAIATELTVSVNTVKSQLRTLYRKLGVTDRDSAIATALDRYLVDPKTLKSAPTSVGKESGVETHAKEPGPEPTE